MVAARNMTLEEIQLADQRSDLRWKTAKRTFMGAMAMIGVVGYVAGTANNWGLFDLNKAIVPVVRFEGQVSASSDSASADATIKALKKAFDEKAPAIILYIDSPGGAPAEAERVVSYLDAKRAETGKKIYTVCGGLCASAGYMVAAVGDEVYAGQYSLVGSIGGIMQTWNYSNIVDKVGARNLTFKSGMLKDMLNPFVTPTPESLVKAQSIVDDLGKTFAKEIQQRRGTKLAAGQNLFTGETWMAGEAKSLGLIDHIATLDTVITEKFGKDIKVIEYNKEGKSKIPFLTDIADTLVAAMAQAIVKASSPSVNFQ